MQVTHRARQSQGQNTRASILESTTKNGSSEGSRHRLGYFPIQAGPGGVLADLGGECVTYTPRVYQKSLVSVRHPMVSHTSEWKPLSTTPAPHSRARGRVALRVACAESMQIPGPCGSYRRPDVTLSVLFSNRVGFCSMTKDLPPQVIWIRVILAGYPKKGRGYPR